MTPSSSSPVARSLVAGFPSTARPSFFRKAVVGAFREMHLGHLRIELPDNEVLDFGDPAAAATMPAPVGISAAALIHVKREAFFKKCVLAGDIGFAESFIDGDWDTPDLTSVLAWFVLNLEKAPTLSGSARKQAQSWVLNLMRFAHTLEHRLRPNSRKTAQANIAKHYDLSNEFFALFLDPSMMYSGAKWTSPELSLEEAQRAKNDALCQSLRLKSSDRVLEIGTGWGGWSLHAAETYGCHVTTVTISQQQFDLAKRRVTEAGMDHLIEVRFQDYRELEGQFDKIVSIEMMEAVGHAYLPDFCRVLGRVLKKDGLLALQFITYPDSRYDELRKGVDFIQKYIFPGSLLLSLNRVNALLSETSDFVLNKIDDLGTDYARTLKEWRRNFHARLDRVHSLGFDERFVRKWNYYLCYCEAAFAMRNISVVQTLHTRANNLSF